MFDLKGYDYAVGGTSLDPLTKLKDLLFKLQIKSVNTSIWLVRTHYYAGANYKVSWNVPIS